MDKLIRIVMSFIFLLSCEGKGDMFSNVMYTYILYDIV